MVELRSTEAFRQCMTYGGHTVRALAAQVGVSGAQIGHLRSGRRSTCTRKVAASIEDALGVDRNSLFFDPLADASSTTGQRAA